MSQKTLSDMFTSVKVYCSNDITKRSYVHTRISGKRIKFYNGKALGILCFPNKCITFPDRKKETHRLAGELYKKLSTGWDPSKEGLKRVFGVSDAFKLILTNLKKSTYSETYIRDLSQTGMAFLEYLKVQKQHQLTLEGIKTEHVEGFLNRFSSSGTYYMNQRRFLSAIFSKLISLGHLTNNPVKKSSKRKAKSRLHEAFKEPQLPVVLNFLQGYNKNLYLCAIIMYGSLLRPHQEIRLLTRKNLADDLSFIILDGYRNKNGNIRKAPTTEYVRKVFIDFEIDKMDEGSNIFTGTSKPLNRYYFNPMWSRAKKKMLLNGIITENQTLYSFRHTAAINIFNRSQNINLVQKIFAHSSMTVSLTYLRSLGQSEMVDEKYLPII